MTTQEGLTFLFNAIALSFLFIAGIDFGTRLVNLYKEVVSTSNSLKTPTQQPIIKLPPVAIPPQLPQLPDPWLLPLPAEEAVVVLAKFLPIEQKHLRLLPPVKEISLPKLALEDLLLGVDIDKLKIRQARKIAKLLGIAQKVNGRDQKLAFLISQIKSKLQQAKAEIIDVVRRELIAC